MAPTLFLVPGLWEGPGAYAPLQAWLEQSGFKVVVTSLLSTGTKYPGNPTMEQDIASIHADLEKTVDAAGSEGVVAVLHSAGGFIGSNAIEGLTIEARKAQQKTGGVRKIVFIAAGIAPEGSDQFGGPFIVDQVTCPPKWRPELPKILTMVRATEAASA
jgi:pimeloyl-ACP methyl ester carboxylesterase